VSRIFISHSEKELATKRVTVLFAHITGKGRWTACKGERDEMPQMSV
jgi:hypothetical protein